MDYDSSSDGLSPSQFSEKNRSMQEKEDIPKKGAQIHKKTVCFRAVGNTFDFLEKKNLIHEDPRIPPIYMQACGTVSEKRYVGAY